jgi:anti-sigma regulatory factor (Ser/Thr protein kinase)
MECRPAAAGVELCITVIDSGDGFDFERLAASVGAGALCGRGIALVRKLCRSVNYRPPGNRVEVLVELALPPVESPADADHARAQDRNFTFGR